MPNLNSGWLKKIAAAAGSIAAQKVVSAGVSKIAGKAAGITQGSSPATNQQDAMNSAMVNVLQSSGFTEQTADQIKSLGVMTSPNAQATTYYTSADWIVVALPNGKFFTNKNTQSSLAIVTAFAKQFNWKQV